MSGQRGKSLQKSLRFLQRLLFRFCRSFIALLMVPFLLLQKMGKKKKPSVSNSFASRRPHFSLKLFKNRRHTANSGFVLPTIAILLLIMSLVVSSLLFRTINRTTQVIGQRNQQVIYNAATPAIDRAKAKLEYLFSTQEPRRINLPSDDDLDGILKNTKATIQDIDSTTSGNQNPYDFPDETRLDLDKNNIEDNAWSFQLDTNGDGKLETIAYSILVKTVDPGPDTILNTTTTPSTDDIDRTRSDATKADKLIVRNGPLNIDLLAGGTAQCPVSNAPERGWDSTTSSATVRRAFQVTAVVIDGDNQASRTVATLEMQQDREADRGNKWGAWFRNDLEIFPGPVFRWNGAMHTEGNLIIGDSDRFRAYLISSPSSCLYTRGNSEITIGGNDNGTAPPFLGQMLSGSMKRNTYAGSSQFDVFSSTLPITTLTVNRGTDSVTPSGENSAPLPGVISLDPVVLFTTNENRTRNGDSANNSSTVRDVNWKTREVVTKGRIINRSATAPYVDDTYRADNRYGPKPQYNDSVSLNSKKVGETIVTGTTPDPYAQELTKLDATTVTTTSTNEPAGKETQGLDGYWERRAWAEGLRVIVGQRLELGNAFGWGGTNDPLYPPVANAASGSSMANRAHEQRQWKTLRDNLAAVQATSVYHQANSNSTGAEAKRNFPIACLATTAHPGTQTTITNSTTFSVDSGGVPTNINFLTGNGTNGWEFNPPAASETAFVTALGSKTSPTPLRIALRNLAYFAGDPYGAFPPRQDTRDSNNNNDAVPSFGPAVHPYPNLAMWGDFSNLRRVITRLDEGTSGTNYSDLSLADKTTLHTAACTLGMLAYKLDADIDAYESSRNTGNLQNEGVDLSKLVDDKPGNGEIDIYAFTNSFPINLQYQKITWVDPNPSTIIPNPATPGSYICPPAPAINADTFGYQSNCDDPEFYSQFTKDQWLNAAGITGSARTDLDRRATAIVAGNQILRDRALGFKPGNAPPPPGTSNNIDWNPITGLTGLEQVANDKNVVIKASCDPDIFSGVTNDSGGSGSSDRAKIGLALTFCGGDLSVKYPALYYLFPVVNHDHDGDVGSSPNVGFDHAQPSSDPYVSDTYIFNSSASVTDEANNNITYQVLKDADADGIEESGDDGIDAIKILPKARSSWLLPNTTTTSNRVNIIKQGTTDVAVPFLDKGIFNGREVMSVRVLDLDLDLLRRNTVGTPAETWLPNSGIVYAFREDAMREDGIARPAATTSWTDCDTANELGSTAATSVCRMNAVSGTPVDPPVNPTTGISPKPVDFFADPDRRPNGFRLRNGAYIRHPVTDPVLRGLVFITDNPLYIEADNCAFNLHASAENTTPSCSNLDTNRIEEFTQLLNSGDWNSDSGSLKAFYNRTTLNGTFGRAGDTWRPAEIIADGITILSHDFIDGSIAEGITRSNVGSPSSYRTLTAPTNNQTWIREDGSTSNAANYAIPIKLSRNGFPLYSSNVEYGKGNASTETYIAFNSGDRARIDVQQNNTRVNATIVSGLVASRAGQSYGGFHNFPRFLENWDGENLHIAGAFIQLNFSTSATAPFDQDSWEPGNIATTNDEDIRYYGAPDRRWGYDVGLQYAPAGPVARRFAVPNNTRSEFYRELPLDDPYVLKLRCARKKVSGSWVNAGIDPQISCP